MHSFSIVGDESGESNITVFTDQGPLLAHSSHPNYEEIVRVIATGEEADLTSLFDLSHAIVQAYGGQSERVQIVNGHVLFDGHVIHNSLTDHIIRCQQSGVESITPFIRFMDKLGANPSEHSRQMLFDWLQAHQFTITEDGNILGYKGIRASLDAEGNLIDPVSINSGTAVVNGETKHGNIPNEIGSVIEMPRGMVEHDPGNGCSHGLHVGTYDYANKFAQGALLECHVNPADVISVPTDCEAQKMRCCRYKVVNVLQQEILEPVVAGYGDYEDEDYEDDYDLF